MTRHKDKYTLITVKHPNLEYIFDFNSDWFEQRIGICFFQNTHFFFRQGVKSKVWDIKKTKEALLEYLSSTPMETQVDSEVEELLKRR